MEKRRDVGSRKGKGHPPPLRPGEEWTFPFFIFWREKKGKDLEVRKMYNFFSGGKKKKRSTSMQPSLMQEGDS